MRSHLEIIRPYMEFITGIFGKLADEAARHNMAPDDYASEYLSEVGNREEFLKQTREILERIRRFWKSNDQILRDILRQLPGLKAGCVGDIGPQPSDYVFERAGMYFDTIIVPDPLLQVAALDSKSMLRNDYYLVKYGIIQCQLRDVYLADITPPIAYLVGDVGMLKASATEAEPFNLAFLDCVMLVNELYDRNFDSYGEVIDHFERFATDEEALRNLARPELFILDQDVERTPEAQWAVALEHLAEKSLSLDRLRGKGATLVGNVLMGRMSQATDILCRTVEQGFHPLVTAPRSYYWLTQKIRLNCNG